ncbi:uncharacterized protein [Chironomus tepperi]|uniref:uncharacterized protein n=1 Tax=Chironomus tepperi TaxID=113505 RepID=UPI00391F5B4A
MTLSLNLFCLLTITLSTCLVASASKTYSKDLLTTPKDECKHICGKLNPDIKNSKCGNPDKQQDQFLVIHDPSDKKDEDYEEFLELECAEKCPPNYQKYKTYQICVKNSEEFEKSLIDDKIDQKTDIEKSIDNTWLIVGIVGGILVIAIGIAGFFIRKRNSS